MGGQTTLGLPSCTISLSHRGILSKAIDVAMRPSDGIKDDRAQIFVTMCIGTDPAPLFLVLLGRNVARGGRRSRSQGPSGQVVSCAATAEVWEVLFVFFENYSPSLGGYAAIPTQSRSPPHKLGIAAVQLWEVAIRGRSGAARGVRNFRVRAERKLVPIRMCICSAKLGQDVPPGEQASPAFRSSNVR